MAQTKNLGKVTVTPQGQYNVSTEYERLDVVSYGGSSWMALQSVTGVTPSAGQYWMQIAQKGDEGDPGDPGDSITVDGIAAVGGNIELDALRYVSMSLTSSQQQTTRENIDAQETLTIDSAMSDVSTNPVQNNVIKAYIDAAMSSAGGDAAPMIYDDATPADLVSVTDGANNKNFKSLVANITPIQTGTGDPSSENIRPITGWTGASVTVCGKNLFDKSNFASVSFDLVTDPESSSYGYYRGNATQLGNSSSSIFNVTYNDSTKTGFVRKAPIGMHTTTISFDYRAIGSKGFTRFYYANGTDSGTTHQINAETDGHVSYSKLSSTIYGINFRTNGGTTSKISVKNVQIELNDSETAYEDYNGTSTTINWNSVAGTVYGGTIDFVSGKLIVTDGYIASYNGETLPSTWISDRDVYVEGNSPTTGAQVVYKLATPTEYTLTGLSDIKSKYGLNNVWANCGSIASMSYPCDTKLYIDGKTAALLAIMSEE